MFSKNRLLKLAQGLQQFQDAKSNQVKFVQKMGQKEIMSFFETDFLCATKWFTYLDEFQFLDKNQQVKLSKWVEIIEKSEKKPLKLRKFIKNQVFP